MPWFCSGLAILSVVASWLLCFRGPIDHISHCLLFPFAGLLYFQHISFQAAAPAPACCYLGQTWLGWADWLLTLGYIWSLLTDGHRILFSFNFKTFSKLVTSVTVAWHFNLLNTLFAILTTDTTASALPTSGSHQGALTHYHTTVYCQIDCKEQERKRVLPRF